MQISIIDALIFPRESLARNTRAAKLHQTVKNEVMAHYASDADTSPRDLIYRIYKLAARFMAENPDYKESEVEWDRVIPELFNAGQPFPLETDTNCYSDYLYHFWKLLERMDLADVEPDDFIVESLARIYNASPAFMVKSPKDFRTDSDIRIHELEVRNFELEIDLRMTSFDRHSSLAESGLEEGRRILAGDNNDEATRGWLEDVRNGRWSRGRALRSSRTDRTQY